MTADILALDFDGVICDSAGECLFSAHAALMLAKDERTAAGLEDIPLEWRERFYQMRPFIRDGKDYLMILYFLDKEVPIVSQDDFDRESRERRDEVCKLTGVADEAGLEDYFQTTRREVRAKDEAAWLDLNPLYPQMLEGFAARQGNFDSVFVTTSKPSDAALRILRHNRVDIPESQVFGNDRVKKTVAKNGHMVKVSEVTGTPLVRIHFLDDQVSHLKPAMELGVQCYLAVWGYNTAEQKQQSREIGAAMLDEDQVVEWMSRTCEASE